MKLGGAISRLFSTSSTTLKPKPKLAPDYLISIKSIKEKHAYLIRTHWHKDSTAISRVLKAYSLSPSHLHQARFVFDQIEQPTLPIFNHMMRGFSFGEDPSQAIDIYSRLYNFEGIGGDNLTFIYLFKACGRVRDVLHGWVSHVHALKRGFGVDVVVWNSLISMYGSLGDLVSAQKVFDEMIERDLVSWNSLICGYGQCRRYNEVLGLFNLMRKANVKADTVTMVKVLLACSYLDDQDMMDSTVKYIEDNRVGVDLFLGNTLIDIYGRRGLLGLARRVFDRMTDRNIVSWNGLMTGYAKLGDLGQAKNLFDRMPVRNVASWSSMITACAQGNKVYDAVELFREMLHCNVKPDHITIASVLSACARMGSLDLGQGVHKHIRSHCLKIDVYVENALIDMYCKCGEPEKALEAFHEMKERDHVTWTSIIAGLAVSGFANNALDLFSLMLSLRIQPTHGNFVGVLLACTHAGLIDKGLEYFEKMEKVYGLTPEIKHYGCIVDLLCRSGNVKRAFEFIEAMTIVPDAVIWRILLGACKLYGHLELAEIAHNKLLELHPANTYAGFDQWDAAAKTRALLAKEDSRMTTVLSNPDIAEVASC